MDILLDTPSGLWYKGGMSAAPSPQPLSDQVAVSPLDVDSSQPGVGRSAPCGSCPLQAEIVELRQQAGYWKDLHGRAKEREDSQGQELEQLKARIKELERELFGRKSEKGSSGDDSRESSSSGKRGQRSGKPGPKRRDSPHLPVQDETCGLDEQACGCSICGLPFLEQRSLGTEDSEVLEIEVKAYKRRIRRKRYTPSCQCPGPGIITAPGPPKLIPKGRYGVSVWVQILLDKYCFLRPTHRLLEDLRSHGLDLSLGTITGGLKKLGPVFEPIMDELIQKNLEETRWHADETSWPMYVSLPELHRLLNAGQLPPGCTAADLKTGKKWKLWLFQSRSAVVLRLDPTRKARVPEGYFQGVEEGVLIVDRYIAYKAMTPVKEGRILLAYCWAHVRRDFLGVAKDFTGHEHWGLEWVGAIGKIFHLNDLRRQAFTNGSKRLALRNHVLRESLDHLLLRCEKELEMPKLHPARGKVLRSLKNHWPGLTLFVENPEIPMDNNQAERTLRKPVCGRKQFYGSYALWSGQLAVMLFALCATLQLWGLNPRTWLNAYLQACAKAGGQAPADVRRFLPWNLSEEQRTAFTGLPENDSS